MHIYIDSRKNCGTNKNRQSPHQASSLGGRKRGGAVEAKPGGVHKKRTNLTLKQKGEVLVLLCNKRMKSTQVAG